MNDKYDRFLWAVLWIVVVLLASCFWFNALFAFNIFDAQHWQHLAQMQASQIPIRPMFYISMIGVAAIAVAGLYVLMRPGLRRIRLPRHDTTPKRRDNTPTKPTVNAAPPAAATAQPAEPAPDAVPTASPLLHRPPRLNISTTTHNSYPAATATTPAVTTPRTAPASAAPSPSEIDIAEIKQIFEDAGYVSKGTPRIKGMPTAAFAIGANETLWIGAIGATTDAMNTAAQTLIEIFTETLDDIEIEINTFIIAAADADTTTNTDIMLFESIDSLREYITAHPSPPLDDEEQSGFDAYSAYMSTVVEYIGKI